MNFREGDSVMHWTFGLGKVSQLEERNVSGEKALYYVVQIGDITVWVPVDATSDTRLRPPTPAAEFKRLVGTLTKPGEALPDDRHQRKLMLLAWLKDGSVESLFRVIRSLATYKKVRPLNDNDQVLLKRTQKVLFGEWGFAMSIPVVEAEIEFHRLMAPVLAEA